MEPSQCSDYVLGGLGSSDPLLRNRNTETDEWIETEDFWWQDCDDIRWRRATEDEIAEAEEKGLIL